MAEYRIERDSMGEIRVPAEALYAAQTQRAVENFPISGIRFPRVFLRALGLVKAAAARVNARIEAPKFHPEAPTLFTEAARHGMSAVRTTSRTRSAASASTASPARWPILSLTSLKSSRSNTISASRRE